jgi:hypothetical protein
VTAWMKEMEAKAKKWRWLPLTAASCNSSVGA